MKNEVNGPLTITIGAIGVLLMVTATLAVDGWYKSFEAAEVADKWEQSPNIWLQNMREKQQETLSDSHRIMPVQVRRYKVSIEDAMKIVAKSGGKLAQ